MPPLNVPGLDRLLDIADQTPPLVTIANWPADWPTVIVGLIGIFGAVVGSLWGARSGAAAAAKHTRQLMEEAEQRSVCQRTRDRYHLLVHVTIEAINSIALTHQHIAEELQGIESSDIRTGDWELIRDRAWSPSPPSALPPECGAMLIEYSEGEALTVFSNLIAGAASLEGNLRRFEALRREFNELTDDTALIQEAGERFPQRSVALSLTSNPKAARIANTLGALALSIRKYIPRYLDDVRRARVELLNLADRRWSDWGFESIEQAQIALDVDLPAE